jgi:hypothetical protein
VGGGEAGTSGSLGVVEGIVMGIWSSLKERARILDEAPRSDPVQSTCTGSIGSG